MPTPEAGRDLDAAVAEKVMGWYQQYGYWKSLTDPQEYIVSYWRPSTDIAAAWQVVEFMREHGQSVDLNWGEDNGLWECSWITGGLRYSGFSKSAALAICRAALEAQPALATS